jgi:dipeptidyl aminopeptidase/acylaminoacyl peptidase
MLTVDDILSFRSLGGTRISPDGRAVVYTLGPALAGEESGAGRHLWIVATDGEAGRQMTYGTGKDSAPAWSPDGTQIAFLSDRGGEGKGLYLLPRDGGEARPLDTGAGAIKDFAWSPDGARIAFVRTDPAPDGEAARGKGVPLVVEGVPRYDRLWTIDLTTREVRATTDAAAQIWEFAWLADGSGLVVVVADAPTDAAWYSCRLARLDLATGVLTTLYAPPRGRQVARPAPSPDGRLVACIACTWSDPGMSGGDLWLLPTDPMSGAEPRNLTAGAEFSVNTATWRPDGQELLCYAYADTGSSIGAIDAGGRGGWRELWRGPYSLSFDGLYPTSDGLSFAVPRSATREPAEVWLGQIADDAIAWRRLTATHGDHPNRLVADVSEVRWTAQDGLALGGLLIRPVGANGPTPLVVNIHGGPTGMAVSAFSNRGMAVLGLPLAARGVATFLPNYRGSNGRGVGFAEANRGDMGGTDWTDIIAGVDRLVAEGIADPDRLGICGWSYGGFMTMWGVTQTTRFKAAVAGAGIANWASFHGASDLHVWDALFYEADPYDPHGIYAARSPIYHSHRVGTPTLILHGDADRVVPPDQGREFFRALKDRGVETQLVLYPGSGHGPHDPRHIRDVAERSLGWLTERLLG